MKKTFFIVFLTFFAIHSYAQYKITKDSIQNQYLISKLDSTGIDNENSLNKYEVEYFNVKFQKERGDFNFTNKKIAFFTGSGGSTCVDKKNYFLTEKDRYLRGSSSNKAYLILFSEEQKEENDRFL